MSPLRLISQVLVALKEFWRDHSHLNQKERTEGVRWAGLESLDESFLCCVGAALGQTVVFGNN